MVKKLIKYDFKAFAKVMLPIYIVLLGIAALYRIVSIFESNSVFYSIFNVSAVTILIISASACVLITFIISIVRFYKNLFTAEGYLSFTLPVTPTAHIVSKLTVSLIFDVLTILTVAAAGIIATAGELFIEIVKAGLFLVKRLFGSIGVQSPIYVIELILLSIVAAAAAHLLTYMCVSVGQLAKKHKVLAALGIYFGIYVAKQIVATLFLARGAQGEIFAEIADYIIREPKTSAHLIFCGAIILEAALGAVYFIITRRMMSCHLNLE